MWNKGRELFVQEETARSAMWIGYFNILFSVTDRTINRQKVGRTSVQSGLQLHSQRDMTDIYRTLQPMTTGTHSVQVDMERWQRQIIFLVTKQASERLKGYKSYIACSLTMVILN